MWWRRQLVSTCVISFHLWILHALNWMLSQNKIDSNMANSSLHILLLLFLFNLNSQSCHIRLKAMCRCSNIFIVVRLSLANIYSVILSAQNGFLTGTHTHSIGDVKNDVYSSLSTSAKQKQCHRRKCVSSLKMCVWVRG